MFFCKYIFKDTHRENTPSNKIQAFIRPGQIVRPMPIGRAWARKTSETRPIFWARTFCLAKKKETLDLQVFSRIGKSLKKLQWIPNTIMNIAYFDKVYISDGVKTALSTHALGNI